MDIASRDITSPDIASRDGASRNSASRLPDAAAAAPAAPRAPRFVPPAPSVPLMRALEPINRRLLVRGYFRVAHIDFPQADRERLRGAVNSSTAAFLAPNHPEFGFDWMMDKELSTHAAPRMASWAAHEIVAAAPWFWRRNNLVANDGGEAAAAYSVAWALAGHAVLLHPEGMVRWTADRVHPLFGGIAEMAIDAAAAVRRRDESRATYIVPVIWKLRYLGDVSAALHREMRRIEAALGLARGDRLDVAGRFAAVQRGILARQMARFGFDSRSVDGLDFFDRQDAFRGWLVADLPTRYGVTPAASMERTLHRLSRAVAARRGARGERGEYGEHGEHGERSERSERDLHDRPSDAARVREAARLGGFGREDYGTATLSQEQIGESLKRIRAALMRRGLRNALHNALPTPYGARVAHVRVAEPLRIDAARTNGDEGRAGYVAELVTETRARMQAALDAVNGELAAAVAPFTHPNPFAGGGAARTV